MSSNFCDNQNEDVEIYRQQNRQADRGYREQQQQKYDGKHDTSSSPPSSLKSKRTVSSADETSNDRRKQIALEREQRMARLRQELKNEDDSILNKKHGEKDALVPGGARHNQMNDSYPQPQDSIIEVNPEELEDMDEEEQMRKLIGMTGFGSTKGECVQDNQSTAARGVAAKNKARKYRQYMNRKSGFNRPLEKMK